MLARKNLTRYINILFTIYILTLLICSIFFYFRIKVMENTFDSINNTIEIKLNLEKTLSSLRDAETAQRGFLITRDVLFLEHYDEANKTVFAAIKKLKTLTRDNPVQQKNTSLLTAIAKTRFGRLKNTMQSTEFELADRRKKREDLLKGRQVMTEARILIETMTGIEDEHLEENRRKKDNAKELTSVYALGIFVFSLSVVVSCYVIMIRQRQISAIKTQGRPMSKMKAEL